MQDWQVETKADNSPVTKADKQANELICRELLALAPHIPIVSEENRAVDYAVRKSYLYSWCVDPLDGTKEFLSRNGQFTVNVALLRGSSPVMGVVVVPVTGDAYWAAEGRGAWARRGGRAEPERISVGRYRSTDPGLKLVGSIRHAGKATKAFAGRFVSPEFVQLGSSLKLLMVASGEAAAYPRLAPTCEWDTAAGHAIVKEAGGRVLRAGVCDGASGAALEDWQQALAKAEEVEYNKEDPLNPYFVAIGDFEDLDKVLQPRPAHEETA